MKIVYLGRFLVNSNKINNWNKAADCCWLLLITADCQMACLLKISWFFWCHFCWKLVVWKMETCENLKGHRDVIFLLVVSDRQILHHFTPKNGFKHEPIRNRWWYSMTKSTLIFFIAVVSIFWRSWRYFSWPFANHIFRFSHNLTQKRS